MPTPSTSKGAKVVSSPPMLNVLVMLGWNDPVVFRAIGRFARTAGWHIESRLAYTEEIPEGWRGDGMIASAGPREDMRRFIQQQAPLQPTVILGGNKLGIDAPSVSVDNRAVGRLAARHFLERNHRHFAWFNTYPEQVAIDRRDGFREELRAAGFDCTLLEPEPFPPAPKSAFENRHSKISSAPGWMRRRQWLASRLRKLPRPLALFALDDQLASEAISVCVEQGWRVPEEISVAGVGNLEFACECSYVPITSVDTGEETVAEQTAAFLDDLMRGHQPRPPFTAAGALFPPRGMVVRQSTDTVAVGTPAMQQAIRFMKDNLVRALSIEEIAAAAGVSRRTLYLLFRQELRRSPAEQLLLFRMELARTLLETTTNGITEIAENCGFGTRRTFDRCFLRAETVSAATWRRQRSNKEAFSK